MQRDRRTMIAFRRSPPTKDAPDAGHRSRCISAERRGMCGLGGALAQPLLQCRRARSATWAFSGNLHIMPAAALIGASRGVAPMVAGMRREGASAALAASRSGLGAQKRIRAAPRRVPPVLMIIVGVTMRRHDWIRRRPGLSSAGRAPPSCSRRDPRRPRRAARSSWLPAERCRR